MTKKEAIDKLWDAYEFVSAKNPQLELIGMFALYANELIEQVDTELKDDSTEEK
jgi:hypothetical protein